MSAVVADSVTVQAITSLAMAPKPRLFFLTTRLDWLEEMIELAHATGELPRHRSGANGEWTWKDIRKWLAPFSIWQDARPSPTGLGLSRVRLHLHLCRTHDVHCVLQAH